MLPIAEKAEAFLQPIAINPTRKRSSAFKIAETTEWFSKSISISTRTPCSSALSWN
jgi:hypothetical protein